MKQTVARKTKTVFRVDTPYSSSEWFVQDLPLHFRKSTSPADRDKGHP